MHYPAADGDRAPNTTLWNDRPAAEWLAAFPIGNGRIGGMVFGGIGQERIALNHESLWRGVTRHRTTPDVADRLPEIRARFFAGDLAGGAALAEEVLGGHGRRIMPYQPAGDLWIELPATREDETTGFRRELDLTTGIASTSWIDHGHEIRRESFVSADHNVLVVRLTTTDPDGISVRIRLDRRQSDEHPQSQGGAAAKQPGAGSSPDTKLADPALVARWGTKTTIEYDGTIPEASILAWSSGNALGLDGVFPEGLTFAAQARVYTEGPKASAHVDDPERAVIEVERATAVTVLLTAATRVEEDGGSSPADVAASCLETAPESFENLRADHLVEHVPPMARVDLQLPTPDEAAASPLHRRLARLRDGHDDPGLSALYFNFGRYLLFSSSRNCEHPANLQGLWSELLSPAWQSDFHLNINLQMNYWPALVANLPETVPPLTNFINRFTPSAKQAARDLYGADGVFLPHATDVWGRATPEAPVCDVWTGAASWLAQHLWWEWEFSRDTAFLQNTAYPYIKECAAFWESFLVPESRPAHPHAGKLVTAPSNSPENSYLWHGERLRYGIGATMDLLLAREIFTNAIAASEILGVDEDRRAEWRRTIDDLAPLQVGSFGQLQEWVDDLEEAEPSHRHVSHLYGIFPGNYPTASDSPGLFAAARTSLERRLAHGGGHTGWSRSWVAALWARFGEGELAGEHLDELIKQFATDALLDLHPPRIFQIDGNLGGAAAVAEMLLQSHRGVLRLLPALPPSWDTGHVLGLRARDRTSVAIEWADSAIRTARLQTEASTPIRLLMPDDRQYVVHAVPVERVPGATWGAEDFAAVSGEAGEKIAVERADGEMTWESKVNVVYVISPSSPMEGP
ncbi:MAG: glycoside hydrolase family 95 protein [Thermomicrobiales bacterium]